MSETRPPLETSSDPDVHTAIAGAALGLKARIGVDSRIRGDRAQIERAIDEAAGRLNETTDATTMSVRRARELLQERAMDLYADSELSRVEIDLLRRTATGYVPFSEESLKKAVDEFRARPDRWMSETVNGWTVDRRKLRTKVWTRAVSRWIDQLRKEGRHPEVITDLTTDHHDASDGSDPVATIFAAAFVSELARIAREGGLRQQDRLGLFGLLAVAMGYQRAEAAKMLDIKDGTLGKHMHTASKAVANALSDEWKDLAA